MGYDEKYGARPLRRVLQREIEDRMAGRLLEGAFKTPTILAVTAETVEGSVHLKYEERDWTDYQVLKGERRAEQEKKEAAKKEAERKRISGTPLQSEELPKPDLIPGST